MSPDAAYFPDALASTISSCSEGCYVSKGSSECSDLQSDDAAEQTVETITAYPEVSDELLLSQVSNGTKDALGLLFRRHAHSVRNVAYRVLRNEAEADDLVQEVFLFIFRKAALFDGSQGAARSWIFQVAYHRAFDKRRYLNSRHFYTGRDLEETARCLADPRDELPFHEVSIEGILGKQLAARFNARLTPEQRETLELFFFEGYALKEIAELTGRSVVNVRSHYYRGIERLRKFVLRENLGSK